MASPDTMPRVHLDPDRHVVQFNWHRLIWQHFSPRAIGYRCPERLELVCVRTRPNTHRMISHA